jgi:hypothetical protein
MQTWAVTIGTFRLGRRPEQAPLLARLRAERAWIMLHEK